MANMKEQHICMMFGFRLVKRAWKVHERSKQFSLTMPLGAHRLDTIYIIGSHNTTKYLLHCMYNMLYNYMFRPFFLGHCQVVSA